MFYVMDEASKVYVWELLENDGAPVKTEQFTHARYIYLLFPIVTRGGQCCTVPNKTGGGEGRHNRQKRSYRFCNKVFKSPKGPFKEGYVHFQQKNWHTSISFFFVRERSTFWKSHSLPKIDLVKGLL